MLHTSTLIHVQKLFTNNKHKKHNIDLQIQTNISLILFWLTQTIVFHCFRLSIYCRICWFQLSWMLFQLSCMFLLSSWNSDVTWLSLMLALLSSMSLLLFFIYLLLYEMLLLLLFKDYLKPLQHPGIDRNVLKFFECLREFSLLVICQSRIKVDGSCYEEWQLMSSKMANSWLFGAIWCNC